jgi:hypothetical protein
MSKKRFNIGHIVPVQGARSIMHGLYGYREVIDTLQWGLADIGHDVTVSENSLAADRINILLGAQMLSAEQLRQLPQQTIIYNFEQIGRLTAEELKPEIRTVAERFRIWEYSEGNVSAWTALGAANPVVHVAVGWAPILRRIDKPSIQDIDVLFYGLPGQLRLEVFHDLCHHGIRCAFLCGMYGSARDELIGRSKLVLNINSYRSRIFEIVRVSYLLANSKAVVADLQADTFVEPALGAGIAFSAPDQMLATCDRLLDDDAARQALEESGRRAFEQRHISPILAKAIELSGL